MYDCTCIRESFYNIKLRNVIDESRRLVRDYYGRFFLKAIKLSTYCFISIFTDYCTEVFFVGGVAIALKTKTIYSMHA